MKKHSNGWETHVNFLQQLHYENLNTLDTQQDKIPIGEEPKEGQITTRVTNTREWTSTTYFEALTAAQVRHHRRITTSNPRQEEGT